MKHEIYDIDELILFSLEQKRVLQESYNLSKINELRGNIDNISEQIIDFILSDNEISLDGKKMIVEHSIGDISDMFKSAIYSDRQGISNHVIVPKDFSFIDKINELDGINQLFSKKIKNNLRLFKITRDKTNDKIKSIQQRNVDESIDGVKINVGEIKDRKIANIENKNDIPRP